jgi:uncharacterized RDD family membrane protein YckC
MAAIGVAMAVAGEPVPRQAVSESGEGRTPAQTDLFAGADDLPAAEAVPAEPVESVPAPLVERLRGGLADLAVQLVMLAVAVTAAYRLGVPVTVDYWPPFAVLALVFSFLYWVIPLAFWGQTPGMAWAGHLARGMDGEPLAFGQTFRRWIGALLTLGLAGLPLLLALGGRSLSDRLSDSKTIELAE